MDGLMNEELIQVNVAEIEAEQEKSRERFNLQPDTEYPVEVSKAIAKNSRAGNPMIEWTFTVRNEENNGATLRHWTVLKGPGAGMFLAVAKGLGLDVEEGFYPSDTIGMFAAVRTKADSYTDRNGDKRDTVKVAAVYPIDEADVEVFDDGLGF